MEKQFDHGKTIRSWKNNSIMEKQFDYGTKFDFEKKIDLEIKFPFSTLKFFYFFRFKELGGRNSTDSGLR